MRFLFLCLVCVASFSYAVIETYEFNAPEEKATYDTLIEELRCPKCQNQNLAGSNSPIAKDLRAKVYTLIQEGKDKDDIVDYLVARYGNFVRYEPPVTFSTLLLWGGPILLLLIGLLVIFFMQRQSTTTPSSTLTKTEQEALDALLKGAD